MENASDSLSFLKLLAHDLRWTLIQALTTTDLRVGELVAQVKQPTNLVSYHLRQLRDGNLVIARRSSADGRDVYYALNHQQMDTGIRNLRQFAGSSGIIVSSGKPLRVLFLCTHNSARSQMAEGLMRALATSEVEVYSAGTSPTAIKPEAIETMKAVGIDISAHQTNHIDEYMDLKLDYVITVCDRARETCPYVETSATYLHWGITPPSAHKKDKDRIKAYAEAANLLQTRIDYFLSYANLKMDA